MDSDEGTTLGSWDPTMSKSNKPNPSPRSCPTTERRQSHYRFLPSSEGMSGAATSCLTPAVPISTLLPLCLILTHSFLYKYFTWVLGPPQSATPSLVFATSFHHPKLKPGSLLDHALSAFWRQPHCSTGGSLGSQCHFQTIIHMPLILGTFLTPSTLLPVDISTCNHVSSFEEFHSQPWNFWHLNSLSFPFHLILSLTNTWRKQKYTRCSMRLVIRQMQIKTKPISVNNIRWANF